MGGRAASKAERCRLIAESPSPRRTAPCILKTDMPAVISLLRGINVGGHHQVKMEALRALYESLGLGSAETYVQSGNVVFRASERDLARLAARIAKAIEQTFDFHADVFVLSAAEMRDVIRRNPFAGRIGIEPNRLLVTFLGSAPSPEAKAKALAIPAAPEELRIDGREMYIYYPNGVGRAKLSPAVLERALRLSGTGRNWNSVTRLLEMAESLEQAPLKPRPRARC